MNINQMSNIKIISFICIFCYFSFCIFQLSVDPLEINVDSVEVIKQNNLNPVFKATSLSNIVLNPVNEELKITYLVNRRFDGVNLVERFVILHDGSYRWLESINRSFTKTQKPVKVLSFILIPLDLVNGCGYKFTSKNSITFSYNILSPFVNTSQYTPYVEFCVDNSHK